MLYLYTVQVHGPNDTSGILLIAAANAQDARDIAAEWSKKGVGLLLCWFHEDPMYVLHIRVAPQYRGVLQEIVLDE